VSSPESHDFSNEDTLPERKRSELAPGWQPPALDVGRTHVARVYDYLLGGSTNFAVDRRLAEQICRVYPGARDTCRANRAFMVRAVQRATDLGIRQFLDLGTGVPFSPNTHEIAQEVAPESRVVYVDNDPVVLAHARALLDSDPSGSVAYVEADLRNPDAVLDDPLTQKTLDFREPIAIILVGVLHFVVDTDRPRQIIARLLDAVPQGSYIAATHAVFEYAPALMPLGNTLTRSGWQVRFRGIADFEEIVFSGLNLLEPGIVTASDWCPSPDDTLDPGVSTAVAAGMARKP
jgi:hypothetical protein